PTTYVRSTRSKTERSAGPHTPGSGGESKRRSEPGSTSPPAGTTDGRDDRAANRLATPACLSVTWGRLGEARPNVSGLRSGLCWGGRRRVGGPADGLRQRRAHGPHGRPGDE